MAVKNQRGVLHLFCYKNNQLSLELSECLACAELKDCSLIWIVFDADCGGNDNWSAYTHPFCVVWTSCITWVGFHDHTLERQEMKAVSF